MNLGKPSLTSAMKLRCLYCGKTPLSKPGSWFAFDEGCKQCDYCFEREAGYFVGATWMVNFPVISFFGLCVAAPLVLFYSSLGALGIATIASSAVLLFALLSFNRCNALWIFLDHLIHPLTDEDRWSKKKVEV
jgi:hypothetical protein